MKKTELISRIRLYLHDPEGKVWDDAELLEMIDRAAACYCADTGMFRGGFDIVADADGRCALPNDYLAFTAGWAAAGSRIESISIGELSRFYPQYTQTGGDVEFVYEDIDTIGGIRLCPNPFPRQHITVFAPYYPYGVPTVPAYGTPLGASEYGIPVAIRKFTFAGDIVYVRRESAENIRDYMAIVYHTLQQAYNVDNDFNSPERAALYNSIYRSRIARNGQMKSRAAAVRKRGKYY